MFLSILHYIIYFKIKDFIVDFSNLSIFYLILLNFQIVYLFIFGLLLPCLFLSSNLIELHLAALSFVAAIVVATLTILPSCKLASCSFIWTTIGTQQLNLNFVDPRSATCERCQLFSPSFSPSLSPATSCCCCCCNNVVAVAVAVVPVVGRIVFVSSSRSNHDKNFVPQTPSEWEMLFMPRYFLCISAGNCRKLQAARTANRRGPRSCRGGVCGRHKQRPLPQSESKH